jgi:hypothetical protein
MTTFPLQIVLLPYFEYSSKTFWKLPHFFKVALCFHLVSFLCPSLCFLKLFFKVTDSFLGVIFPIVRHLKSIGFPDGDLPGIFLLILCL